MSSRRKCRKVHDPSARGPVPAVAGQRAVWTRFFAAVVVIVGAYAGCAAFDRHNVRFAGIERPAAADPFVVVSDPMSISALQPTCMLLDARGAVVTPAPPDPMGTAADRGPCMERYRELPHGEYTHVLRARCQPERRHPWVIDTSGTVPESIPLPEPATRYLRPGQTLHVGVEDFLLRGERTFPVDPPANTRVEVLRQMPDAQGACTIALLRIVDSGPWSVDEALRPPPWRPANIRFAVADVSQLTEAPTPGITPEQDVARRREAHDRQGEQEARAAEAVADTEIANNRCTPEHATALQRASQHVQTVFAAMGQGSSPDSWTLESQEVFVAAPQQRPQQVFRFNPRSTGGEFHIFAIAFMDLDFIVVDPTSTAIMGTRSGYEDAFRSMGGSIRGQMFRVAPGQRLAIGTRGRGCSLLMVFRHG
jgi:hypothetical protein